MPESGSLGSVRGALSNGRPYREQRRFEAENRGVLRDAARSRMLRLESPLSTLLGHSASHSERLFLPQSRLLQRAAPARSARRSSVHGRLSRSTSRASSRSLGRQQVRFRAPLNRAPVGRCATPGLRARPPPDPNRPDVLTFLLSRASSWSIPLSHDPFAGVFLLSGVGAGPPPDGVG